jgi:hypothetical protein
MPLPDVDHRNFGKVLAVKQSVAASLLTVTARVNGGRLRPSNDDGLADLLAHLNGGQREVTLDDVMN